MLRRFVPAFNFPAALFIHRGAGKISVNCLIGQSHFLFVGLSFPESGRRRFINNRLRNVQFLRYSADFAFPVPQTRYPRVCAMAYTVIILSLGLMFAAARSDGFTTLSSVSR